MRERAMLARSRFEGHVLAHAFADWLTGSVRQVSDLDDLTEIASPATSIQLVASGSACAVA
jgi:hypothetical protein